MEEYAQQFTPDPPVKESLTTDWDELKRKWCSPDGWSFSLYNVHIDGNVIFDWFKNNIGGGK